MRKISAIGKTDSGTIGQSLLGTGYIYIYIYLYTKCVYCIYRGHEGKDELTTSEPTDTASDRDSAGLPCNKIYTNV
jgi:hypothetical protein